MSSPRRPAQYYLAQLDPSKITAAREMRGYTKKELADLIEKSASAVSQFESGKSGLDLETFVRLAMVLSVPPSFFSSSEAETLPDFAACHFRAKLSVAQTTKRKAYEYARRTVRLFEALERRGVQFPDNVIGEYEGEYTPRGVEQLGAKVRKDWGLGLGPIVNMLNLLESRGVFVILLPPDCEGIDACTFWEGDRPCIAINYAMPASRLQFDLGHELAHLLKDRDTSSGDSKTERIANHFSGAFLAPAITFQEECPWKYYRSTFLELKSRWRISISAALFRARQLDVMSEASYRWAMVTLSKNGERSAEPGEFARDVPMLLRQGLEILKGEITIEDLAEEVRLNPNEVELMLKAQLVPDEVLDAMRSKPSDGFMPKVFRLPNAE